MNGITKFFISFLFIFFSFLNAKEILMRTSSAARQVKFELQDRDVIFTEKYQNINGQVRELWLIDNDSVAKDEYEKKYIWAGREEERIKREAEERLRLERELQERQEEERKKREEQEFMRQARLETLRSLLKLELEAAESALTKLDKYALEPFFIFDDDTFSSPNSLQESRIGLLNRARNLIVQPIDSLNEKDLRSVLVHLERLPEKVDRFFKQSIKFAINKCNDTKRLKELLSLIS